ncbi:activating signal cointegrator 1 complex subunit1-like [Lichtheimia corymbifera JMRC:FSU:9682]|uniref:Activating signal cointegrator 1 complex subunit1-like n=1 Tax=Lichtheimia corymbifera JMRC:FSU:9682 TaxID=1263082 RepID=A0A068RI02_9FUNG|nr:activating signal cointegrator 1 complex subunit1-like [Lichtheimia corymbifera JMRC:FSU:9682]
MASSSSTGNRAIRSLQGISLVKVQGRNYRVNTRSMQRRPDNGDMSSSSSGESENETIYTEEIITYHHPVHPKFHGKLIGRGGSTLKSLRVKTGTRIDINKTRDTVMIKGTKDKVQNAANAIDEMLYKYKERIRPTHFLSLPIASTYTARKFEEFRSSILSSTFKCQGLDESIIVDPANIHITLGVFKLLHQDDIEEAVRFLKHECPKIVREAMEGHRNLSAHLRDLKIMQTNPAEAHVLYIEPKDDSEDGVLRKLCTSVNQKMMESGLMVEDDRPLKLHVTLINTAHRAKSPEDSARRPFDARPILKEFGNLDLGTVQFDKLHLMQMGRRGPGGTYISEGSIPIIES